MKCVDEIPYDMLSTSINARNAGNISVLLRCLTGLQKKRLRKVSLFLSQFCVC